MSLASDVAVAVLLAVAALVTAVSSIGVLVMRDPFQRLHFVAPPSACAFLVVAALAIDGAGLAAFLKGLFVAILLTLINGIVTHATARAVFVHRRGKWPPDPGEAAPAEDREGAP